MEEFFAHSELEGTACNRLTATWVYLIKFTNDDTPKRQEISLEYATNYGPKSKKKGEIGIRDIEAAQYWGGPFIDVAIRHTQVTFGYDLANNFQRRIKRTVIERDVPEFLTPTWFKTLWLSAFLTIALAASTVFAGYAGRLVFSDIQTAENALRTGAVSQMTAWTTVFSMTAIIAGFLALPTSHKAVVGRSRAFIVLNEEHEKDFDRERKRHKKRVGVIIAGVCASLIVGVVGSLIATGIWEFWKL